jgi:hypothetical protein
VTRRMHDWGRVNNPPDPGARVSIYHSKFLIGRARAASATFRASYGLLILPVLPGPINSHNNLPPICDVPNSPESHTSVPVRKMPAKTTQEALKLAEPGKDVTLELKLNGKVVDSGSFVAKLGASNHTGSCQKKH